MLFTSSKLLKTVQYCPMFHVLGRCFAKAPLLKVVETQRVLLRQKAPPLVLDCPTGGLTDVRMFKGFLTSGSNPLKLTIRDYLKSKLLRLGR